MAHQRHPKAPRQPRGLTRKQEAFVVAYLRTGSASEAYREAYDCAGMSTASVGRNARHLLRKPIIAARLSAQARAADVLAGIDTARILEEARRVATSDLRQAFGPGMVLIPVEQWSDELASAVASVEVTTVGGPDGPKLVTKLRAWPKVPALDMLMRHKGLYEKDNAQKRPHEQMTDDELRAAIADALDVAGIPVPGAGASTSERESGSGGLH